MEANPLHWPEGWPRASHPTRSRFDCTFAQARDGIMNEIRLMGGSNVVLSTNIELRRDGLPYANQSQPDDKGVAVYFRYKDQSVVFACDRWNKIEHNLQAIRKTIEAMRGVERWGVTDMLKRAFTGFKALPETGSSDWWAILNVSKDSSKEAIKAQYRALVKKYHPDNQQTGSNDIFRNIHLAYEQGMISANA